MEHVSIRCCNIPISGTYVFDVRASVDGDNIAMLNTQVMSDDTVDASAAIIKVVICEHDQDCVLSLLALDQYCVSSEEL